MHEPNRPILLQPEPRRAQRLPLMGRVATLALAAVTIATGGALAPAVAAQDAGSGSQGSTDRETIERLRRDQDEILRKAERLERLMQRLLTRYEREGKQEQVEYLKAGLAHLESTGILSDVAGIREDLASTALTEAMRKQRQVVDELERLLNILLARKSIESIDEDIEEVREQTRTAAELERRQRELMDAVRDTVGTQLSPTERELTESLESLSNAERREAQRNTQQAGLRRPFLESALQRVEELLQDQDRLERGISDEQAGRTPAARRQAFDLGELTQNVRELQRELKHQRQQQALGEAGRELQQAAAGNDPEALQEARDRIARLLENAPPKPGELGDFDVGDNEWSELRRQNRGADPTTEDGRSALEQVGRSSDELAGRRNQTASEANRQSAEQASTDAQRIAEQLARDAAESGAERAAEPGADAQQSTPPSGQPQQGQPREGSAASVQQAGERLAEAQRAVAEGDTQEAERKVAQALSALDRARAQHRAENPDAGSKANEMAAEARAAAQELANAPSAEQAERDAQQGLQQAAEALREVADQIERQRSGESPRGRDGSSNQPRQPRSGQPQSGQPQPGEQQSGEQQSGQPQSGEPSTGEQQTGQQQSGQPQSSQQQSGQQQSGQQSPQQAAQQSREALEQAREALQQALEQSAEGVADEMQAAQQRQQELNEQAQQAQQQLQQAAQNGDITEQQQQAAQQQIERARQSMERASQQLQSGQQASAAREQDQAADAMQQAADAIRDNQQLDEQQRQQLAEQAARQQELTEDIIQLARELQERDNDAARRAVEEAADASRKAQRAMEEGDADETQRQQERAREQLEQAQQELQEEEDRYQDLRQEELLFKMKEELTNFLDKQRPITEQTKRYQETFESTGRLPRSDRRSVNELGEQEQALAGRVEFLVNALQEDGNLVYESVLSANLEDLREVSRRLAGRSPEVSSFTTLLQADVERRSEQLLDALERELQRREQERQERQQQEQQQQQNDAQNRFNPQREKLVSLIAELEMLKSLGQDTRNATENLQTLVEVRGDETISEAEVAMIQRLHHRHSQITRLFEQIKAGVEQALQAGQEQQDGDGR